MIHRFDDKMTTFEIIKKDQFFICFSKILEFSVTVNQRKAGAKDSAGSLNANHPDNF